MRFGNWLVTEENVSWNGGGSNRFVIPLNGLNQIKTNQDGTSFYNWILLATAEDWLTQNDLYDLNYAFVYAIARSGQEFNYDIFDETLAEQYEQFDAEDNEETGLY